MIAHKLTVPILAPVMHYRPAALAITAMTTLQVGLTAAGLPGWQCPMLHGLGIPCPGCGLTRATVAMLHGDWQTVFMVHIFAPVLVIALVAIALAALLGGKPRQTLLHTVEIFERRTGLTAILLIALVVYWGVRLIVDPVTFIALVKL